MKHEAFNRAMEDGVVLDPKSGKEINLTDEWDMGHRPGYEYRKMIDTAVAEGWPQKKYRDAYNNPRFYRPELPNGNRGHSLEAPDDVNYWPDWSKEYDKDPKGNRWRAPRPSRKKSK